MGTYIVLLLICAAIGGYLGLRLIKRGASKAQASGYTRDRIDTTDTPETRTAIERWAQAHGYERTGDGTSLLRYQKHVGAKRGQPTFLDVIPGNGVLSLESYVGLIHPMTRKPQEGAMPLGAPGMILSIPRKSAKRDHNELRATLGLPAIG